MSRKEQIENLKEHHKHLLQDFDNQIPIGTDLYVNYYINNQAFRARCFGNLFGSFFYDKSKEDYANPVLFPLKFNRRKNWFNYNALFKELNKIYGYYFKIGRYYSGFRNTRLVDFYAYNKPRYKALWWAGLYSAFLLLRKINLNYYTHWDEYFANNNRKKPVDNWFDVIYISETKFADKTYYLDDKLFKLCYYNSDASKKYIKDLLQMLEDIYGKGIEGNKDKLSMSRTTFNSSMFAGLKRYLEDN